MKNELITNLATGVIDEVMSGSGVKNFSSGIQKVFHGKAVIEADKDVSIRTISAQENVILTGLKNDMVSKHEKAELAKEALRTVASMDKEGNLTDTKMLAIFNFTIAVSNDL